MPPAKKPRAAQSRTIRCRYIDERGERCRRVGTVGNSLCRHHAIMIEMELDDRNPANSILGIVDRVLSGRARDPRVAMFTEALGGYLSEAFSRKQRSAHVRMAAAAMGRQQPNGPPTPPTPPTPRPPKADPVLEARAVLGFDGDEKLTAERIRDRKKALARVYHPDMSGGSKGQMQRVLAAADLLLAKM